MPHATLKLLPGVDVNSTLALNQAALSLSNLIRYLPDPDPNNPGFIQKLGGWTRYYPNAMPSVPRALWAWEDTNAVKRLAVGCDISTNSIATSFLGFIQNNVLTDITPRVQQDNPTPDVTVSTSSTFALIQDTGITTSIFDMVFVPAHISVGSIILFGSYQTIPVSNTTYDVQISDALGNPMFPGTNAANAGTVADFTTSSGSAVVTVHLNNHGFIVGDTYPILIQTAVGGITLSGNTIVQAVQGANSFTILAHNSATSGQTVSINSGSARFNYYLSFEPNPPGLGFGRGPFGSGGFGTGTTPTPSTGTQIATKDWNLDNFGETLMIVPTKTTFGSPDGATYQGGPLFYWSPEIPTQNAIPVAQAPISNAGMFVGMPQRQIITYGTTVNGVPDPLLIRWCDIDNFFLWIGQVTNQAGQFRLPRGSKIVGGLQVNLQGLLFTDLALWSMQYIGVGNQSQSVYSFNEIGTGCGLISQKAVATIGGNTYWMGQSQFFKYTGEGVVPIQCPIWDNIFPVLDKTRLDEIRAAANSNFNEVSWFVPTTSGDIICAKLNVILGQAAWDYSVLPRSAWIDQSVLGPPIGADPTTNFIQQHETSNDADGQPLMASFQTGYFVLSEADVLLFVDQIWPDMKWGYGTSSNAQVMLTFFVVEYPTDTNPQQFGPFTLSQAVQYVTPRFRGRLVSMKFENFDIGTFWRLGACRYRFAQDGKFL